MDITSIIIHYKRPENMKRVIEGIRSQTIKSEIWVWDNSGDCPSDGVDVMIRSSRNFYCQARFLMMGFVKTKYVYNQDDDLACLDPQMLEKMIAVSELHPYAVIGWNGRKFHKDINWEKAYSYPDTGKGGGWVDSMPVRDASSIDMINVGVSFWRTELINQVQINPFQNKDKQVSEEELKYGDDMWISQWLENKRTMDFDMRKSYEWLNEHEERGAALSKQCHHMDYRNLLCRRYWEEKYK